MEYEELEFIFSQKDLSRREVRKKVVDKFIIEKPGPVEVGTLRRYQYTAEKTNDGDIVILVRPANLKMGFDFRIDVKDFGFNTGKTPDAPSHLNILDDLKLKHNTDSTFAEEVRQAIIRVIDMEDPEDVIKDIEDKGIGLSVELLLKISKWFAIEMDIRYWNGWGRNKYKLWLDGLGSFNYNYEPIDTGYVFYDRDGKKITEPALAKLMGFDRYQDE